MPPVNVRYNKRNKKCIFHLEEEIVGNKMLRRYFLSLNVAILFLAADSSCDQLVILDISVILVIHISVIWIASIGHFGLVHIHFNV